MQKFLIMVIWLTSVTSTIAQVIPVGFRIKYITPENVYLDGGSYDGLMVGDTLLVKKDFPPNGLLKVKYTSASSAACEMLTPEVELSQGDTAIWVNPRDMMVQSYKIKKKSVRRQRIIAERTIKPGKRYRTLVSGSASLQWYHIEDQSSRGYNFNQPALRLNLKINNLYIPHLQFRVKARTRYSHRVSRYSTSIPTEAWQTRLYTISLLYDHPEARWQYQIGRIVSNRISGIGPLDGLMLQLNIKSGFYTGILGGSHPEWQYGDYKPGLKKYGLFIGYEWKVHPQKQFASTVAIAGEYHHNIINREFLYIQNSFFLNRLSIYQSAEIDINRQWKLDRTGEQLSMTNLYLRTQIPLKSWMSLTFGYDSRKNVFTYEWRSQADSLFDDAMRTGLRAGFKLKFSRYGNVYLNFSKRTQKGNWQDATAYSGGLYTRQLGIPGFGMDMFLSGYSNGYSNGQQQSIRFTKQMMRVHQLETAYGQDSYTLLLMTQKRKNQWIRMNGSFQLKRHIYLSGQYEHYWGHEGLGSRIFGEFGYRF